MCKFSPTTDQEIKHIMQTWTMVSIDGTIDGYYVADTELDRVVRDCQSSGQTVYTHRPENFNAKHIREWIKTHNDRVISFYYSGRQD